MITEIRGIAGSGKSSRIYTLIGESLAAGRTVFLIVPEQTAVSAERRLSVYCAEHGIPTVDLEIVSFRRLANRVFREYGGLSYHYIGQGGKSVITWRVLGQLCDKLKYFRGISLSDISTVSAMCAQLDELRSCGITPTVLERASEQLGEGVLADKLSDLSLISAAYGALLSADYDDPKEDITRLAELLEEHDFFVGKDVFLDSFYGFTPDELRVIGRMMKTADNLTIALQASGDYSSFHDSSTGTERQLRRMIPSDVKVGIETLSGTDSTRAPVLRDLTALLCSGEHKTLRGDGRVGFYICRDRYEEAEAAAGEILAHVRSGGRFSDCSVIVRRTSDWEGIADAVFSRHGIPCFISRRSDAVKDPAVRLITSSLEAVGHGWQTEDVIEILKTGLTPLTAEQCDTLEIYASAWHIRGRRWYDEYEWNMNPSGYSSSLGKDDEEILRTANDARARLVPPLMLLDLGSSRVSEYCRAIYAYLLELGLPEYISTSGEDEPVRLWNAITDALDTLSAIAGELTATADTMSKLIRLSLAGVTIGRIPTCVDEVTIGSADLYRPEGCRLAMLLGCCDGEFPSVPAETGLLSDRDRERLGELGIEIGRAPAAALSDEFLYFYMALSAPSRRLVLTRHTSSGDASACSPSEGWSTVLSMLADTEPVQFSALPPSLRVFSAASALDWALGDDGAAAMNACGTALSAIPEFAARLAGREMPISVSRAALGRAIADAIYGDTIGMSNSMIETYSACAFSYFGKYVLGLSEGGGATFRASDVGNYIHDMLERFVSELSAGNLPAEETEAGEYSHFVDEESERYENEILRGAEPDARQQSLFRRLRRTARLLVSDIADELRHSSFKPSFFELPFGLHEEIPPVEIEADGMTARLGGRIDRVDLCRQGDELLVKVTDYKTGTVPDLADSPSTGKGMQLLIYLLALCRDDRRIVRLLGEGYVAHGGYKTSIDSSAYAENGSSDRDCSDIAPSDTDNITSDSAVSCADITKCDIDHSAEAPITKIRPAAAFYTEVRTPSESASGLPSDADIGLDTARGAIRRRGIMLDDPETASALDDTGNGHFIPANVKRDGSLTSRSGALLTADEIAQKCDEATEAVRGITAGIRSGHIDASPMRIGFKRTACDYCAMRQVCRSSEPKLRRPTPPHTPDKSKNGSPAIKNSGATNETSKQSMREEDKQ